MVACVAWEFPTRTGDSAHCTPNRALQETALESRPPRLFLHTTKANTPDAASKIKARRVETLDELLASVDVLTVNCPLHEATKGLINSGAIAKMKKGAWIVNTARGAICDRMAIADALKSGHIAGYAGDVWGESKVEETSLVVAQGFSPTVFCFCFSLLTHTDVQPAPKDHPWRDMRAPNGNGNGELSAPKSPPFFLICLPPLYSSTPPPPAIVQQLLTVLGMVPHYSGTTLDAQERYAKGTKEIIENFLAGKPQNPANVIVENGDYASRAYGDRKK
jgi:formate dehydrogenase